MIPILYNASETAFSSRGIGALSDAVSCVVTEERNGVFELEMRYSVDGLHYSDLENNKIILALPNNFDNSQPFRIYDISKPISGIVKVRAQHISYDLSKIPLRKFTAANSQAAMVALSEQTAVENPFSFHTDKNVNVTLKNSTPISCRKLMGGVSGSVLDVYGGEWKFDKFSCYLYTARGSDNGVTIRYGKNLIDLTQEENIAACCAGIYPYWANDKGELVVLDDEVVYAENADHSLGVQPVDFSGDFETAPEKEALLHRAQNYIAANDIATPAVSIKCSFAQLAQSQEYADFSLFETVRLCDTVTVYFERLGVNAKAKVIKTVYDCLKNRYTSIELGEARNSLASTVQGISEKVDNKTVETVSRLQADINRATSLITGNTGGYVVIHDTNADGKPDEILIMSEDDINSASNKVWRWNKSGLGYSGTGYEGPYGTAITEDGAIVANYITAGELNADIIKSGMINAGLIKMYDEDSSCGLGVGHGSTDVEDPDATTTGAIVWGGAETPAESKNYLISTNAGVRMSSRYDKANNKRNIAKIYVSTAESGALAHFSTSNDSDNYARIRCENNNSTMFATGNSSTISNTRAQVGISSGFDAANMLSYLVFNNNGTTNSSTLYAPTSNTIETASRSGSVNTNEILQTSGTSTSTSDSALTKISSTGRVDISAVTSNFNDSEMCGLHLNSQNKTAPYSQIVAAGDTGTSSVLLKPDSADITGKTITVGTANKGVTVTSNGATINGKFVQFGVVSITSSDSGSVAASFNFSDISGCSNFKQDSTPFVIIQQPFSSGITLVTARAWNGFTLLVPKTGESATRQVPFIAFGDRP